MPDLDAELGALLAQSDAVQPDNAMAPRELGLWLARTARTIRRLPRNIRRNLAQSGRPAPIPSQRPATATGNRPRIAVVAAGSGSEVGGAERFYLGLCDALDAVGMASELVAPLVREDGFANILSAYRQFYDLDLSGFDGVISTKAPSYALRHPNHVCYLVHTIRAYYDMFETSHPHASARTRAERARIQAIDTAALKRPRHLFTIGEEVTQRLKRFNGLEAETLHFPGSLAGLKRGDYRYLFLPGRLHPWKRIDLAIAAMRHVRSPVRLVIAGTGQEELALKAMARGDARIEFTGRVTDEKLASLYADALAVIFLPRHEDFGLITLEAFNCEKPVICCSDSGEPARMVTDGKSGFVCDPDPRAIAQRIEQLAGDPTSAAMLGREGKAFVDAISWDHVARSLCQALGFQPS